jgi:hypothetical protein
MALHPHARCRDGASETRLPRHRASASTPRRKDTPFFDISFSFFDNSFRPVSFFNKFTSPTTKLTI